MTIFLTPNMDYVHPEHQNKDLNGYVIKGFYLLKKWFKRDDLNRKEITFMSNIEGSRILTLIPSPDDCPGLLGLYATKTIHGFEQEKIGFTLTGAPGRIDEKGFCEQLILVYPSRRKSDKKKSLDFKDPFLNRLFYKLKRFIKHLLPF